MMDNNLLKDWVSYQKHRQRITTKMPETEIEAIIENETIVVRPRDPDLWLPRIISSEHLRGYTPEGIDITLTFRRFPPMILRFGTPQAHGEALRLMRRIVNEENDNVDTPPDSSLSSTSSEDN